MAVYFDNLAASYLQSEIWQLTLLKAAPYLPRFCFVVAKLVETRLKIIIFLIIFFFYHILTVMCYSFPTGTTLVLSDNQLNMFKNSYSIYLSST